MYGQGGGSAITSGLATTTAGVAILPNTGGNSILTLLSIASIVAGVLIITSFAVIKVAKKINR